VVALQRVSFSKNCRNLNKHILKISAIYSVISLSCLPLRQASKCACVGCLHSSPSLSAIGWPKPL